MMPIDEYGGELVKQDTIIARGGNFAFPASSSKVDKRGYIARAFQGMSVLRFRLARSLSR